MEANRQIAKHLDDTTAFPDYDWLDEPLYAATDLDFVVHKRRCADGSSPSSMSSRFTGRFDSIAKKLKTKRERRTSSVTGSLHEAFVSRSRASSVRPPSIFDKGDIPPTPVCEEPIDSESIMQLEENAEEEEEEIQAARSRTPLLPPVLAVQKKVEEVIQSPLQSPSVDATPSLPQSPFDSPNPFNYLPSPPLSTKPSMASFHHRPIMPASDIPTINLTEIQDEWSARLGHENFTIAPEPYQLPAPATLVACQRLKADWELAKSNFDLHLERIGQVYSETSKVYHLTLVKWADINLRWKCYHEQALEAIPRISQETLQASFHSQDSSTLTDDTLPVSPVAPMSPVENKFPALAAGGIIGPMERIQPCTPRSCRKRSFWKFLQGVWGTVQA